MLILRKNVLRFDLLNDNSTVITQQYINPALVMSDYENIIEFGCTSLRRIIFVVQMN